MRTSIYIILFSVFGLTLSSCLKKDFETPPDLSGYDPQVPVNFTIADLKSKLNASTAQQIDSDWTIYGIITADDRSGNFYKQIVIEDASGGITINIEGSNLYTKYPIGRKIYIKLKGLYFGYNALLPQLGGVPDNEGAIGRIPAASVDNYIVRANYPNQLPTTNFIGLNELKNTNWNMVNRLVQVDGVQIVAEDTGKTYAQPPSFASGTSITLRDCAGNKIVLRTSGYSSFQNVRMPTGKGSIKAIYTVYNNIPQLVIRDTSDVLLSGVRCVDSTITSPTTPVVSIDSIRKLYSGTGVLLGNYKVKGVVISDAQNKNVATGSVILQDGDKGIMLYWGGAISYNIGDSLVVDLAGDSLIMYQGALEIKKAPGTNKPLPVANNRNVTPKQLTIAQLNADFASYESTLIKILSASVVGGGTYSGSKTLTDGTGTIVLYTAPSALFSGESVPSFPKTFVGIVTPFTGTVTKELKLRDPDIDVY